MKFMRKRRCIPVSRSPSSPGPYKNVSAGGREPMRKLIAGLVAAAILVVLAEPAYSHDRDDDDDDRDHHKTRKITLNLTAGTNMAAAVSPAGPTIVFARQTSLWSVPVGGGAARQRFGVHVE